MNKESLKSRNIEIFRNSELKNWFVPHAIEREGEETDVYIDPVGVPTVGIGHALGYIDDKTDLIRLYPQNTLNGRFVDAGFERIDGLDYVHLQRLVNLINSGNTSIDAANKELKPLYDNQEMRFTILLPKKLLDWDIDQRVDAISKRATDLGVDFSTMPMGVALVAFDLYFRGGTKLVLGDGHRNTKALQTRNIGAFMFEALLHSDKKELPGNDIRMFEGVETLLGTLTPAEREQAIYQFSQEMLRTDGVLSPADNWQRWQRVARNNGNKTLIDLVSFIPKDGAYIWRTMRDSKVRSEHQEFEGQIFEAGSPPPGDHPGEDYGCRCWAEPVGE